MDRLEIISQIQDWIIKLRSTKTIFELPEVWLFVNILGIILLWTTFYYFIRSKLNKDDKKIFIAFLIFGNVLTFVGLPFYLIKQTQTISIFIFILAFAFIVFAPFYSGWTLINFKRIKQVFISKFKKNKSSKLK